MIPALYSLGSIGAALVMAYPFHAMALCALLLAYSFFRVALGAYRG